MTNLTSMDKRYKTRDGQSVRILMENHDTGEGSHPIVALVGGVVFYYTNDGRFYSNEDNSELDLIETSQEHCVWIEVSESFGDIVSCSYESENSMRNSINNSFESNSKEGYQLIATKKVTCVEGESCL